LKTIFLLPFADDSKPHPKKTVPNPDSETVMKVHSAATTVRKARKPKGKRQDEGTGGELKK
jgi:hypothetical protein